MVYSNLGESEFASEAITKAYELRQRTSEVERYNISALYFSVATGDLERGIQVCQVWSRAYPRDRMPLNLMGYNYGLLGKFQEALPPILGAIHLDPKMQVDHALLVGIYLALNRLSDARAAYDEARSLGLDYPFMRLSRFLIANLDHDSAEMEKEFHWAEGRPGSEDIFLAMRGEMDASLGLMHSAREWTDRAVASASRNGLKETAALWRLRGALRDAEVGQREQAEREIKSAQSLTSTPATKALAALALGRIGQTQASRKLVNDLAEARPEDVLLKRYWLPATLSAVELSSHQHLQGKNILEVVAPYELVPALSADAVVLQYPSYLRGIADLELRDGSGAASEFKKIIDRPYLCSTCSIRAVALVGLARAYAVQGDTANARSSYQSFLNLWKNADTDIPLLKESTFCSVQSGGCSHQGTRGGVPHKWAPSLAEAFAQFVKEIIENVAKQLVAALNAGHSEALTGYLKAVGRFHRYSLHSVMLIASQKPALVTSLDSVLGTSWVDSLEG